MRDIENNIVWKDIPEYEGLYQVNNYGLVKNKKGKYLSSFLGTTGYYGYCLYKNGKRKNYESHKLVAMSFLNHKPCGFKIVVDHIDNNKLNNNLSNLRLVSNRENTSKHNKVKTSKYVGVCWSKKSKKWQSNIYTKGKTHQIGTFDNEEDAYEAYKKQLERINE